MGVFSGMQGARPTAGGNYVRPGDYVSQIQRVRMFPSADPKKKGDKMYIVETLVLSAKQTDDDRPPNAQGSRPSWVVNMDGGYPDLAMGNVKNFLLSAYGALMDVAGEKRPDADDIDGEVFAASCDWVRDEILGQKLALPEDEWYFPCDDNRRGDRKTMPVNPLGGVIVAINAFNKPTQAGHDFTRVNFDCVEDYEHWQEIARAA